MHSDSGSNPFFDLFLQIRPHFLCFGTVLSITLMELTAAAYSHSLLFLLLLTSLLWSTNNTTSLPYISPTITLISVSHKFYCYCFFKLWCIVANHSHDPSQCPVMTHCINIQHWWDALHWPFMVDSGRARGWIQGWPLCVHFQLRCDL